MKRLGVCLLTSPCCQVRAHHLQSVHAALSALACHRIAGAASLDMLQNGLYTSWDWQRADAWKRAHHVINVLKHIQHKHTQVLR